MTCVDFILRVVQRAK